MLRAALALAAVLLGAACGAGSGGGASSTAREAAFEEPLVDVLEVLPDAALDIRYATSANFVKEAVYPVARCLLRRSVALRLRRVAESLHDQGYRLLLWDCYRPFSVQERLWRIQPDERFVAKPVRAGGRPVEGSKHNRGAAVDVSLVTADGHAVEMPTAHDEFSDRAVPGHPSWTPLAAEHAKALDDAMRAQGFSQLATEWWHYDAEGWEGFSLLDVPLATSAFGDDTR